MYRFQFPTEFNALVRNAASCRTFKWHGVDVNVRSRDPLVVEIAEFLSATAVDALLSACQKPGGGGKIWSASTTTDHHGRNVRDDNRTSSTSSLAHVPAALVRAVICRAATMSGFSQDQIEPGMLVRYLSGESFGLHHDAGTLMYRDPDCIATITGRSNVDELVAAIPDAVSFVNPPVRIVTMFVYLNDNAAGTRFPFLNLDIEAKSGKCVMFSNYSERLGQLDPRTSHEGVRLGSDAVPKFGLNLFVSAPRHTRNTVSMRLAHMRPRRRAPAHSRGRCETAAQNKHGTTQDGRTTLARTHTHTKHMHGKQAPRPPPPPPPPPPPHATHVLCRSPARAKNARDPTFGSGAQM
jgi:hypothetical protein